MTEPEWLSTDSPARLFQHVKSRLSARKLQLLACGCCRLLDVLFTPELHKALSVVERHADGLADRDEYQNAVEQFGLNVMDQVINTPSGVAVSGGSHSPEKALSQALMAVVSPPADFGLGRAVEWVATAGARVVGTMTARKEMGRRMCAVFHEVVGNPFLERVVAGPEWLAAGRRAASWMLKVSETARAIAIGVQAEQAFDRLPILADALEDDGCNDSELLQHFRFHSHHLRGCWALDLVLGKS